jgi:nicotinamide phosphoribosyltransferase
MIENLIIATDAYKLTHHLQYPADLTKLYSYAEARVGGRFETVSWFGLQAIVADHLLQPITTEMIDEAQKLSALTFGTDTYFNREVWEKVRDLGYLPIRIKALPEGLQVPAGVPLFTLESTQPWFATTLNALETVLMHVWYPTTIATNSHAIKTDLKPLYEKSGNVDNLSLAVNDFGLRGATSLISGARAGAAHLLHFRGSDNLAASQYIADHYQEAGRALSVWATEHSVATSYGPGEGEINYVQTQLDRSDDDAILSIVIDSYDALGFVPNVIADPRILPQIKQRAGRVVLRPDSGDPIEMDLAILEQLDAVFGHTINDKGYKVLNDNVGIIQGDGMKRETIAGLYEAILAAGWSADNVVVGSGGGLLQQGFTRDTQRFAIKASYAEIAGQPVLIQKQPKTDSSKRSKAGRFKVIYNEQGILTTVPLEEAGEDILRILYEDGVFSPESFATIVQRAEQ